MKLYIHPFSPNCYDVLAVADHLEIPLERIQVDPFKGETRTPEYLKNNPNGKVPTLVDGNYSLWESNTIMQYLAGKKPGNSLWPTDEGTRIEITRWQIWQQAHWMHACGILLWERLVKKLTQQGDPDPKEVEKGEQAVQRYGAVLNQCLEGKQFLLNDQLTLADFSVASPLFYAQICKLPIDEFAHLKAWYHRVAELEAWKRNMPQLPS